MLKASYLEKNILADTRDCKDVYRRLNYELL